MLLNRGHQHIDAWPHYCDATPLSCFEMRIPMECSFALKATCIFWKQSRCCIHCEEQPYQAANQACAFTSHCGWKMYLSEQCMPLLHLTSWQLTIPFSNTHCRHNPLESNPSIQAHQSQACQPYSKLHSTVLLTCRQQETIPRTLNH